MQCVRSSGSSNQLTNQPEIIFVATDARLDGGTFVTTQSEDSHEGRLPRGKLVKQFRALGSCQCKLSVPIEKICMLLTC